MYSLWYFFLCMYHWCCSSFFMLVHMSHHCSLHASCNGIFIVLLSLIIPSRQQDVLLSWVPYIFWLSQARQNRDFMVRGQNRLSVWSYVFMHRNAYEHSTYLDIFVSFLLTLRYIQISNGLLLLLLWLL